MTAVVDRTGVDRLVSAAARGRPILLAFDFDGTLSPTVAHPESAIIPRRTQSALARLCAVPRCRVGIISSRSLDDLRRRVGASRVLLVGSGGLEWEIDGARGAVPEAAAGAAAIAATIPIIAERIRGVPGAWLESKPLGLTIHHREAGPETGPAVRELADRLIRAPGTDLRVVPCALGVEITPRLDYDKGTGIQTLVAAMGSRSPFVVYGGNDANDAEAMVVVRRLQGWTIGVGPHAPPSDQLLEGPEKVADWLEAVAEGLCGGGLRHA